MCGCKYPFWPVAKHSPQSLQPYTTLHGESTICPCHQEEWMTPLRILPALAYACGVNLFLISSATTEEEEWFGSIIQQALISSTCSCSTYRRPRIHSVFHSVVLWGIKSRTSYWKFHNGCIDWTGRFLWVPIELYPVNLRYLRLILCLALLLNHYCYPSQE